MVSQESSLSTLITAVMSFLPQVNGKVIKFEDVKFVKGKTSEQFTEFSVFL